MAILDTLKNLGQRFVENVQQIPQVFSAFGEAAKAREQAQRVQRQLEQVRSVQQSQIQQPQVSPEATSGLIGVDKSQVQIPQIKLEAPKVNTSLTSGGVVNLPKEVYTGVETSAPTIKEIENLINQKIQEKIPQVIATPVPPPPTEDVSRQEWKNILDKYGVTQNLTQLETLANTINAANQAFDEILAEKQKEPAMKESFKQKMMNFLIEGRDKNIKALQAQYDALKDALNTRLSLAKDELGVYEKGLTRASTERERAIDNTRQLMQLYVSSGTMGEVDDETLRNWSSILGVSINTLKGLRKAVKTGNDLKVQKLQEELNNKIQSAEIARQRLELAQQKAVNAGVSSAKNLTQSIQPRDFTDEEFMAAARDNISQNKTFEQTIAEIDANPFIKNKDRAKLIASEIYKGTKEQKTSFWRNIFGRSQTIQTQAPQTEQYFSDLSSKILDFNKNFKGL